MGFHQVEEINIRGPARIIYGPRTLPFPANAHDIFSDLTLFDTRPGWNDLGATRGGVQISISDTDTDYKTVDQTDGTIFGSLTRTCNVTTQLASLHSDTIQYAWNGSSYEFSGGTLSGGSWFIVELTSEHVPDVAIEDVVTRSFGVGEHPIPETKRLVIASLIETKLIYYAFRNAYILLQDSSITHAKTGEQQTVPIRFVIAPSYTQDITKSLFVRRELDVS